MNRSTAAHIALVILAAAPAARAQAPDEDSHVERQHQPGHEPPRNYFNLRVGASTLRDGGRTEICGEGAPTSWLSIEGCGNGAQLFFPDAPSHSSHYMAKLRIATFQLGLVPFEARAGLGFTEMEVGHDGLGYHFTSAGQGESTSGPETSASLRAFFPLGKGFELLVELRGGLAYLHYAPDLIPAQSRWQPSLSLTGGVGF